MKGYRIIWVAIFLSFFIACSDALDEPGDEDNDEVIVEDSIINTAGEPNIIFILLDDVSADEFNFYDGPGINTPTLDKMAKNGVVVKTAYSQPICGPSRATLITGKYAHKNGHFGNENIPTTSIYDSHYTIGRAMQDVGYKTGWFGKQHIDRKYNPDQTGFDYYFIYKFWDGYDGPDQLRPGQNKSVRTGMYGTEWYWHPGVLANGVGVPSTEDDFGPDMELDSLLSFVEVNAEKPYFVYWPTNLPHSQYNTEDNIWEKPETPVYDTDGNMTGERNPGTMETNLEFADFAIGKLLDKLEETNQLDNTVIFVMGDNGTAPSDKGKPQLDIAIQVPLVIYGPGVLKPTGMSDVLIDLTDFMPTFVQLAGGSPEDLEGIDGKSFADYLIGNEFESREWISAQLNEWRWMRTREWLLDGRGDLYFCGDEFNQSNFELVRSSDERYEANKAKLQKLLDDNIPPFTN